MTRTNLIELPEIYRFRMSEPIFMKLMKTRECTYWSVVELVVSSSELLRQLNERILGQASTFVYGFNFDERRQNRFKKSEKSRKKSEILNNSPRISSSQGQGGVRGDGVRTFYSVADYHLALI